MQIEICSKLVGAAASKDLVTVSPTTKLEDVAALFEKEKVNAAPVVDGFGKCIGIITSSDLVHYESIRSSFNEEFKHGIAFELSRDINNESFGIFGKPFDEVAYHMSTEIQCIEESASLTDAGRKMCQNNIHHLLILDDANRPCGMLSSLDLVREMLNECDPS